MRLAVTKTGVLAVVAQTGKKTQQIIKNRHGIAFNVSSLFAAGGKPASTEKDASLRRPEAQGITPGKAEWIEEISRRTAGADGRKRKQILAAGEVLPN